MTTSQPTTREENRPVFTNIHFGVNGGEGCRPVKVKTLTLEGKMTKISLTILTIDTAWAPGEHTRRPRKKTDTKQRDSISRSRRSATTSLINLLPNCVHLAPGASLLCYAIRDVM